MVQDVHENSRARQSQDVVAKSLSLIVARCGLLLFADPSLWGLADATRLDISVGVWACRHTMF